MREKVLIIGAGPAGLALALELQRHGVRARLLEGAKRIGQSWRNRHEQLTLNTHRRHSSLPGLPIPREFGDYPNREAFISYLESCAETLPGQIQFETTAQAIKRSPDGWLVVTNGGEFTAENVVVATGSDQRPFMPEWPGADSFTGELIHAAHFRHADQYLGKKVMIVGAGNSGIDLGNHLAKVAIGPSWLSARNGSHIAPLKVLGVPGHPILILSQWLPVPVQDALVSLLSRVWLGDLSRYGMPKAPKGPVSRCIEDGVFTAIDNGFVKALKQGRFAIVPEIARFDGDHVELVDGQRLQPDAVICATGYRLALEGLVGELGVLDKHGRPNFVAEASHPDFPGLWFFGQNSSIYGNMYIRKGESRRLAAKIAS